MVDFSKALTRTVLNRLVPYIVDMWPGIEVVQFNCNDINIFTDHLTKKYFYHLNVDAVDIVQSDTFIIKGKCKPEVYEHLSAEYIKMLL